MRKFRVLLPVSFFAALASVIATAPAASADSGDVVFTCTEAGSAPVSLTYSVSITAPKRVKSGSDIPLTVTATKPAPADIPARGIVGDMEIVVGGSGSGRVTATELANAAAVPKGQPLVLGPATVSVPTDDEGVYTFTPGSFVMKIWVGSTLDCQLPNGGPVLAKPKTYVY